MQTRAGAGRAYLFVVDLHVADLDLVRESRVGAVGHAVKQGVAEPRDQTARAVTAHHRVRLARACSTHRTADGSDGTRELSGGR